VRLGPIEYRTRDYAVLRVTTTDGLVGSAVGYTRGTPVLPALETLGRVALTLDASEPAELHDELAGRFAPGWPQLVRAASLLDVAAWDVAAQRARMPLHRLLGAQRGDVPLMAVGGYFADVRPREQLIEECAAFAAAGVGAIKLILAGQDQAADAALIADVAAALPPMTPLGVDFHGRWREATTAAGYLAPLTATPLRFVEDPFPPAHWRELRELAGLLDVPLAAGEDCVGLPALRDVLEGARVLRLDATVSGGITTAVRAIEAAAARGARVVPHVFPYVHAPLCAAFEAVERAELIPASVGADPLDRLLADPYPVHDGRWACDEAPGLGLRLDFEQVAELADAHVAVGGAA